jgi:excinuclease ABC subunit C
LEYHIGNCKAPCENLQSIDEYDNSIYQIKNILKGNINEVILHLKKLMNNFSDQYKYEDADKIKQKILLLERYKSKSTIVNPKLNNIDVFSIYENDNIFWVNFIKVINGAIVQSHTVEIKRNLEEKIEEVLLFAIIDIREKVKSVSKEIIIPYKISSKIKGVKFICPKEGDKKKLLDLSLRNAKQSFILKQQALESVSSENHALKVLEIVKKDLQLKKHPYISNVLIILIFKDRIRCISVVFVNGKPEKSAYRHYNIKTVKGANDFASMEEIVYRRYRRLLYEKAPLPGLVIIDGGKGQLNAAVKSLKKLRLFRQYPLLE